MQNTHNTHIILNVRRKRVCPHNAIPFLLKTVLCTLGFKCIEDRLITCISHNTHNTYNNDNITKMAELLNVCNMHYTNHRYKTQHKLY